MPMSKCRFCGKMIPNPYHKNHEARMCIQGRISRGEFVSAETKARANLEREVRLKNEYERSLHSPLFASNDETVNSK
jgi:hypothetical protein